MSTKVDIKRVLEALLFAAPEPLSLARLEALTQGLERGGEEITRLLDALGREYERDGKSFMLLNVAQGYQLKTCPEYAPWVKHLFQPRRYLRLSRPTLETLAVIAYKQPVTRQEIEAIRGVNVDGIIKHLLEIELIKISGQKEVVGRPYLYRTSQRFLEQFGLNSLDDLPPLEPQERPSMQKIQEAGGPAEFGRPPAPSQNLEVHEQARGAPSNVQWRDSERDGAGQGPGPAPGIEPGVSHHESKNSPEEDQPAG